MKFESCKANLGEILFGVLVCLVTASGLYHHGQTLDHYERVIAVGVAALMIGLSHVWSKSRLLILSSAILAASAVWSYHHDLSRAETAFGLKYFLSSQSAVLWMCMLFALSLIFYGLALCIERERDSMTQIGSRLAFIGVISGLVSTLVRWYETHLVGADIGHIPIGNLYEVLVFFCWLTAGLYLYFESRFRTRSLGVFAMLVINATSAFLLWYAFDHQAQAITPLVPALQSWWMKLHVPANFVGYGCFSLAAMFGFASLLKHHQVKRISEHLPSVAVLDDMMYRSIAIGFSFFTIATILGALWAADAWGGYWSWDPKETWALIVWLNYAAWLHLRLVKGMTGIWLSWWALVGLLVTTFAFLGVNLFLSGLHSYGRL